MYTHFNKTLPNRVEVTAKKGWFHKDCVRDTTGVSGSVNQCQAAIAVHNDTAASTTKTVYKGLMFFNQIERN